MLNTMTIASNRDITLVFVLDMNSLPPFFIYPEAALWIGLFFACAVICKTVKNYYKVWLFAKKEAPSSAKAWMELCLYPDF